MAFISYIRGTEGKGQSLRGTKAIFGNREYKKTNFRYGEKWYKPLRGLRISLRRHCNGIPYYSKFNIVMHSNDVRGNASAVQVNFGEK